MDKRRNDEFENTTRFHRIELGHHYLVLYPDIQKSREVYSDYVKGQIQEEPDSVTLVLPYFDTTEKVRDVLESKGVNVTEHEKEGSLIIVDIEKVIKSSYFELTDAQRLEGFAKQIESKHQGKTILVIADMSVFNHLNKSKELLQYERNLHKDLRIRNWKELCLYHEKDFRAMFAGDEVNELLEFHKDRVITVR
jgi:KaiC/GvpD/RAD55 family RecA-like ATPase